MKCKFCEKDFKEIEEGQTICENCLPAMIELTNGKDEENE